jgi:class 3 adenylate cyclase/pimeloyl-ACP methyl ester carboxylesterase
VIVPETHYLQTADDVYIAWQEVGAGPIDVILGFHHMESNVDLMWDEPDWRPFMVGLAEFGRLILHDRRGLGVSSRNVAPPNLETQAADILAVLDAAGSKQAIVTAGALSLAPYVLLAATHPERVAGVGWNNPVAKGAWAPDYPWGEPDAEYEARQDRAVSYWGSTEHARSLADLRGAERLGIASNDLELEHRRQDVNTYGRIVRNSASPDAASEIYRILHQTDVRALLPLVQAPALLLTGSLENVDETRYVASLIPNARVHVIEGRSGLAVDAFLRLMRTFGGIPAPAMLDTILATVVFTDLVGSTARHAALGDQRWKELVERHHELVRGALQRWRGVEQDTAGDGFFATFDGPARAIHCAREIVDEVSALGLDIRIGVHIGECEVINGKPGGLTVTIGARIAAEAEPSEILISQTVRDLVAGSGFRYNDAGERALKGIPGSWHLWSVTPTGT